MGSDLGFPEPLDLLDESVLPEIPVFAPSLLDLPPCPEWLRRLVFGTLAASEPLPAPDESRAALAASAAARATARLSASSASLAAFAAAAAAATRLSASDLRRAIASCLATCASTS